MPHVCGNLVHDIIANSVVLISSFFEWSKSIKLLIAVIKGMLARGA